MTMGAIAEQMAQKLTPTPLITTPMWTERIPQTLTPVPTTIQTNQPKTLLHRTTSSQRP